MVALRDFGGLSDETAHHVSHDEASLAVMNRWISGELIEHTKQVWSPVYEHSINDNEAIEILTNVKRLAETLIKIRQENAE